MYEHKTYARDKKKVELRIIIICNQKLYMSDWKEKKSKWMIMHDHFIIYMKEKRSKLMILCNHTLQIFYDTFHTCD